MRKPVRPARRRRASATPARRDIPDARSLLDRVLDTPHLAHVVPQLPPEVLHRVIESCGLADCGELVGLATPAQLAAVFDLDLWRAGQPSRDEQFDADRFGVWLEVLMESGASMAAQTVAQMNVDLVMAALAQHLVVVDPAAGVRTPDEGPTCDIGGYRVVAIRNGSWDAIADVLLVLDVEHPDYFHRLMRGCRTLSNSGFEIDGLNDRLGDREQVMFDLAFEREQRRDKQGYVTPAQARAFLKMSRQFRLGNDSAPRVNPVAQAYFRAIEWAASAGTEGQARALPAASGAPSAPEDSTAAVAFLVDVLVDAGVLPQAPRALLDAPQAETRRLALIQTHMQSARDRDPAAHSARSQELAYLTNTIVAGCSIQARPFTLQEATEAAIAVCNLALQNWPTEVPDGFLADHDLVTVFQAGWAVLYERVCLATAERLIGVLTRLRCEDREIQKGLDALRVDLRKQCHAGTPWLARDGLDVLTSLDMPAWAALLGLIDECPVMHAAIGAASSGSRTRAISASAFEFISENSQIAAVDAFMRSLPDTLRG